MGKALLFRYSVSCSSSGQYWDLRSYGASIDFVVKCYLFIICWCCCDTRAEDSRNAWRWRPREFLWRRIVSTSIIYWFLVFVTCSIHGIRETCWPIGWKDWFSLPYYSPTKLVGQSPREAKHCPTFPREWALLGRSHSYASFLWENRWFVTGVATCSAANFSWYNRDLERTSSRLASKSLTKASLISLDKTIFTSEHPILTPNAHPALVPSSDEEFACWGLPPHYSCVGPR